MPPFLARSAHLVASLTLAPAAADSTQHRPSSGRLIFSPTHVLYCCFSALCVCTCFVSIQHPALMVAARPAVVRYTPDHSHGPSRCQESDRPTSVVYALLMYLPAGDSQERRGDAMRKRRLAVRVRGVKTSFSSYAGEPNRDVYAGSWRNVVMLFQPPLTIGAAVANFHLLPQSTAPEPWAYG